MTMFSALEAYFSPLRRYNNIRMMTMFRAVPRSASVTTVLSQLVVKNAVELLSKSAKRRHAAGAEPLQRVGPPVDPGDLVTALETSVKDEINTLAVEHPDMTMTMSDRVAAGAAEAEQV